MLPGVSSDEQEISLPFEPLKLWSYSYARIVGFAIDSTLLF